MNGPNRHSIIERIQEQQHSSSFSSAFQQPNNSFFNNSSFEPESLEEFDFESAPPSSVKNKASMNSSHLQVIQTEEEDDDDSKQPIPQSSGLTQHSTVTSHYANSTTPILQQQQQQQQQKYDKSTTSETTTTVTTEEYSLEPIKDDTSQQETLKSSNSTEEQGYLQYNHQQQQNSNNQRHSSTPKVVLKDRHIRNYQIFPGNTRFLCHGRLVTSEDYRAFIAGLIIFITPTVLFAVFVCPFLWNEVHPAVPIVFAYLFILALASMLKTSWTDPGIIPRNLDPIIEEIVQEENESINADAPPKEILIKNTSYALRYCDTCKIYRPPRSSHCRQCDNCIDFEDHHCVWLNNCIGKRNYRSFFTFIACAALLCIFVISSIIYQLLFIANQGQGNGFGYVFLQAPVSFVLAIYCFFLLWMVGGLTLFHCSLILRGVTTHENIRADIIKAKYPDLHINPYNKLNPFKNMVQVLCQPQPKSFLRRRKLADSAIKKL